MRSHFHHSLHYAKMCDRICCAIYRTCVTPINVETVIKGNVVAVSVRCATRQHTLRI
ncbi:hypothetical protein HCG51_06000 [Tolypothrix sp. PCC 7910]|uniref:hypothetical protein n=1 Tax=Tolypothrix sp. PCC 7910 TaxID=2099387 RepID=UPI0014278079|nr:hypothetical protein [Tolypothrix sp. PCC 7910]QIR36352.1 hypothetical protein HCG51_06000 [Tolypothrix sp. PCC 7910]